MSANPKTGNPTATPPPVMPTLSPVNPVPVPPPPPLPKQNPPGAAADLAGKPAERMSTDRLVCGVAVPTDARPVDGGPPFTSSSLRSWVQLELGLPILVEHGAGTVTVRQGGGHVHEVGAWRRFALLEHQIGAVPPCLLALGQLDAGDFHDALLADLDRNTENWGLSIRAQVSGPEYGLGAYVRALPEEISLTYRPALEAARLLGVGERALDVWSLLVGPIASVRPLV